MRTHVYAPKSAIIITGYKGVRIMKKNSDKETVIKENMKQFTNFLKEQDLIQYLLFFAPILGGLMNLWSVYLLSFICICGIIKKIKKNRKFIMPKGIPLILFSIYIFSFLIVEFWAIDKGMNILGFFKNGSIILFWILLAQYDYDDAKKKACFNTISYSAVASVFISLLLAIFCKEIFFMNNRLQGTFMYANSYGIFLLIGLIILLYKDEIIADKKGKIINILMVITLLIGIILTNSRAIYILSLLGILGVALLNIKKTEILKKAFFSLGAFFVLVLLSYSLLNIENRVNSEMFESSEFLTRILYYEDAINMIKQNPLGYGYRGYYYEQTKVQTAVYDTMFVHNSVLQILLDVGIIPTICLIILVLYIFFDKKQSAMNRLILLLLFGHSIIDFDLEFLLFEMILILMLNFKNIELKNEKIKLVFKCFEIIYGIFVISAVGFELKLYSLSYGIVPFYTQAIEEDLYSVSDKNKQFSLAQKIYPLNKNVSGVYEIFSNVACDNNEYDIALEYEKEKLNLNKYAMINYIYYTEFLDKAISYYGSQNDIEEVKVYMEEVLNMENKRKETIENTNLLCYKTKHTPNLTPPEEYENYVKQVGKYLNNLN